MVAGVAVTALALDQLSKWWVLDVLDLRNQELIRVGSLLDFALARNTGVNFGIFAGDSPYQQYVLATLAALVSLGVFIWASRSGQRWLAVAGGLVIGGALGNAIDRVREGAVIDFLNFDCCGIGNPYAFNIADAAIFAGAVAMALLLWRDDPAPSPQKDATDSVN
ncbi:MAG: signal peptidase II [Rhodobacteraceae bacterium]|nr:signal peptidase II [Paracoccaceae bacterium]